MRKLSPKIGGELKGRFAAGQEELVGVRGKIFRRREMALVSRRLSFVIYQRTRATWQIRRTLVGAPLDFSGASRRVRRRDNNTNRAACVAPLGSVSKLEFNVAAVARPRETTVWRR